LNAYCKITVIRNIYRQTNEALLIT